MVLGIAALASSYAAFQSEVWHGEQASQYTLAEQARTKASTQAALSAQLRTLDINLFSQWLDAYAHGDQRLQLFYRTRFRPEFAKVFEAWVLTPFRNEFEGALVALPYAFLFERHGNPGDASRQSRRR